MPLLDTMTAVVRRVLGTTNDAVLRKLWPTVLLVTKLEPDLLVLDDTELRARSTKLRERVVAGTALEAVMVEAFALAREAADRRIGMWNAVDERKGFAFPDDAWGDALGAVKEVRAKLATGTDAFTSNSEA